MWNEDVKFFDIYDISTDQHIASFYLDPYSRPGEKKGGAWMNGCLDKSKYLNKKPVAYLICNGKCPIISHVIIPFKKLMNPNKYIQDDYVFSILNHKFSFLKLLSNHHKSNIIIHPNISHYIHQYECEKIKCNIDYLILDN